MDQATGVKDQDQEIKVVLGMAMGLDEVDVEALVATEVEMVEVVEVDEEDEKVQLEV